MQKHTPGPWEISGNSFDVMTSQTGHGIATVHNWNKKDGENNANARLIAAAPELLDLAKEALAQLEKMDFTLSANWNGSLKTNIRLLLSAAIAKAEGQG